jgi:three-Cys-motif partner protein
MSGAANPYDNREQTWVKHDILRRYLVRLAVIVGTWVDSITYVDCFSGPWENKTDDFSDTSFAIAIEQLKAARDKLAERDKILKLRCLFIEKNASAFAKLKRFSESISDVEILPIQGELQTQIEAVCQFVKAGGQSNFPFIFIDPTGWTGFPMEKIAPLLQLKPGEILVNFMTSHIRRFVDQEGQGYSESFAALYGNNQFREKLRIAPEQDREDMMVSLYGEELKRQGGFEHVVYTPVFQPEKNAVHFHLIYASRHQKGLSRMALT